MAWQNGKSFRLHKNQSLDCVHSLSKFAQKQQLLAFCELHIFFCCMIQIILLIGIQSAYARSVKGPLLDWQSLSAWTGTPKSKDPLSNWNHSRLCQTLRRKWRL